MKPSLRFDGFAQYSKPSVLKFAPEPWNMSSGRFVRADKACWLK